MLDSNVVQYDKIFEADIDNLEMIIFIASAFLTTTYNVENHTVPSIVLVGKL